MAAERTVLYYGPDRPDPSPLVSRFAEENALVMERLEQPDDVRARPRSSLTLLSDNIMPKFR